MVKWRGSNTWDNESGGDVFAVEISSEHPDTDWALLLPGSINRTTNGGASYTTPTMKLEQSGRQAGLFKKCPSKKQAV